MSYYLTERGGSLEEVTIVLGGELDLRAAPALRDALRRAVEAGVKHVTIDLTDATFVDSTAIGPLLAASARIRDAGNRLTLICTNKNVLRTVEIAGLHRHIATN